MQKISLPKKSQKGDKIYIPKADSGMYFVVLYFCHADAKEMVKNKSSGINFQKLTSTKISK